MTEAYIGIGSNIKPEENILKALSLLMAKARVVSSSVFYRTKALGKKNQPDFYNGVWLISTSMLPEVLKNEVLRGIESALGRKRNNDKYASRTIDLDLILFGHLVLRIDSLTVPDPDIYTRPFLSIPVAEISPDLVLPDSGKPVREIAALFSSVQMEPLNEFTETIRKNISAFSSPGNCVRELKEEF